MSHFRNDDSELHAQWCESNEKTAYNVSGICIPQQKPLLPDIPPALFTGKAISVDALDSILADPNYEQWGLIVYRFPSESLYPEIQFAKRNGKWIIIAWAAPEFYKPTSRVLNSRQVISLIWQYVKGENVYPAEIEAVGTGVSQRRMFFSIH